MEVTVLAQDIMDLYYQDYKSDEQFFEHDYFMRQVKYEYDSMLFMMYEKMRQEIRQEGAGREYSVSFDPMWLNSEEVDITPQKKTVELKSKIFAFPFDTNGMGVQDIIPIDYDSILARTTESELFMQRYMPKNETTFWYPVGGNVIGLKNPYKGKLKILYVPQMSDDLTISDSLAASIQKAVLQTMYSARNGATIDDTNDQNLNDGKEVDTNKDQLK